MGEGRIDEEDFGISSASAFGMICVPSCHVPLNAVEGPGSRHVVHGVPD